MAWQRFDTNINTALGSLYPKAVLIYTNAWKQYYGTTMVQEAERPLWAVAVIVTVPRLRATTFPVEVTVAMLGLLQTHVTVLYRVFFGSRFALSVTYLPVFKVKVVLFSVMDDTASDRTVTVQEAVTPLLAVAVI
jgi:hypothetical protein